MKHLAHRQSSKDRPHQNQREYIFFIHTKLTGTRQCIAITFPATLLIIGNQRNSKHRRKNHQIDRKEYTLPLYHKYKQLLQAYRIHGEAFRNFCPVRDRLHTIRRDALSQDCLRVQLLHLLIRHMNHTVAFQQNILLFTQQKLSFVHKSNIVAHALQVADDM